MFTFRLLYNLLWSPYGIGQTIIFSSCGFFMAALCHRTGHYIFAMWFLSIFYLSFFSSPNLSSRRLDVYHTLTHGVALCANLECRSEMCCTRLAANTGRKKVAKNRHLGTIAQLWRAISSQLRHCHISTIGTEVGLSPGDFMLDGDPTPLVQATLC